MWGPQVAAGKRYVYGDYSRFRGSPHPLNPLYVFRRKMNMVVYGVAAATLVASAGPAVLGHAAAATGKR